MILSSRMWALSLGALLNAACYGTDGGDDDHGGGGSVNAGNGGATNGGSPARGGSTMTAGAGAGATAGGFSECVDTLSDVGADEVTALGFSGNDVLGAVGGTHETDLLWLGSDLYASHALGGTVTPLTLVFADTVSASRYVDSQGGGCVGGDGPCLQCQSRAEVDVGLQITSGDGALDELFTVTLTAAAVDSPTFSKEVPAADLQGTYLDGVTPEPDYSLTGLHLEGGFGVGFSGSHTTVPGAWNGFVAATVRATGGTSDVMQAHGYFPKETGM